MVATIKFDATGDAIAKHGCWNPTIKDVCYAILSSSRMICNAADFAEAQQYHLPRATLDPKDITGLEPLSTDGPFAEAHSMLDIMQQVTELAISASV
jgi:hypothetical protein